MQLSNKYLKTFIILVLFSFCLMPATVKAVDSSNFKRTKDTEYYDWSDVTILDEDYSFSTIYLTEQTEFIIYKNDGSIKYVDDNGTPLITKSGKKLPFIYDIPQGGELVMLVTKCAVNKDNELLDVLIKVNNVIEYTSNGVVYFSFKTNMRIPVNQYSPSRDITYNLDVGDPIYMELGARYANCDFTMTYYKSGTYDYSTDTGKLGNIHLVNGMYADIDILPVGWQVDAYKSHFLQGYEGIVPNVGSSKIFYNKSMILPEDSNYHNMYLQELDNGIAVAPKTTVNVTSFWYANMALMLTDDIPDSTFSMTYGGIWCGMFFFFSSPYPYEITNPTKEASDEVVTMGKKFTYEISQYVPNNYYAGLFNIKSVYGDSNNNSKFTSLIIKDSFDKILQIDKDSITVTDEAGDDVTDKFDIVLQDNELKVIAKEESLNESTFYTHTYTVHVPASVKEGTKGIASFNNVAVTTSKMGDDEEKSLSSNEVEIGIIYRVFVHYLKEGTNENVAESRILEYKLNDKYSTDYSDINGLELIGIPDNASGTIIEDIVVNYYYKPLPVIIDNPKTGPNGSIIIASTIILIMIIIYFYLYKYKNLYKYE